MHTLSVGRSLNAMMDVEALRLWVMVILVRHIYSKKKLQPKQPLPHLMALQLSSLATSKGEKNTHTIL